MNEDQLDLFMLTEQSRGARLKDAYRHVHYDVLRGASGNLVPGFLKEAPCPPHLRISVTIPRTLQDVILTLHVDRAQTEHAHVIPMLQSTVTYLWLCVCISTVIGTEALAWMNHER